MCAFACLSRFAAARGCFIFSKCDFALPLIKRSSAFAFVWSLIYLPILLNRLTKFKSVSCSKAEEWLDPIFLGHRVVSQEPELDVGVRNECACGQTGPLRRVN